MGKNSESYVKSKKNLIQTKITNNNVEAFAFISHQQFLVKSELLKNIFPQPRNWALTSRDEDFDKTVDRHEYMRLSTTDAYWTHLGNSIPNHIISENSERKKISSTSLSKKPSIIKLLNTLTGRVKFLSYIMRFPIFKRIVLRLHGMTFHLLYNIKG